MKNDIASGIRQTRRFQTMAEIKKGEFFIVGGQVAYIAELGEEFMTQRDSRLRVILRQRDRERRATALAPLHRDEAGRRITDPVAGRLFTDEADGDDLASGTINVLRSKSDHPVVAAYRDVLHKIGVTGGDVDRQIANAAFDPTFLMADMEIVATHELYNIHRTKLESSIVSLIPRGWTSKSRIGSAIP